MDEQIGKVTNLGRGSRMSAKRKRDAVLQILRGEDLEIVSRDLGIIAAKLSSWRDSFLIAGKAAVKYRSGDERDSVPVI
jgi:transposase